MGPPGWGLGRDGPKPSPREESIALSERRNSPAPARDLQEPHIYPLSFHTMSNRKQSINTDKRLVAQIARAIDRKLPAGRKKKKQQDAAKSRGVHLKLGSYARMLDDPCSSALEPGIYGDVQGYTARFHATHTDFTGPEGAATSGFVLWAPNYHCGGASTGASSYNLFCGGTAAPSDPLSRVLLSTYSAAPMINAIGLPDPAYNFCQSDTVASARCIGACMRIGWTGNVTTLRGQIAVLKLPLSVWEEHLNWNNGSMGNLTVNQLFQMSSNVMRTPMDGVEVKFRPSFDSTFRSCAGIEAPLSGNSDDYFVRNNNNIISPTILVGPKAAQEDPMMIGFAWRNLALGGPNQMYVDLYKNIEWKPDSRSGLAQQAPVQTGPQGLATQALQFLDRAKPGWDVQLVHVAQSKVARAAMTALALVP